MPVVTNRAPAAGLAGCGAAAAGGAADAAGGKVPAAGLNEPPEGTVPGWAGAATGTGDRAFGAGTPSDARRALDCGVPVAEPGIAAASSELTGWPAGIGLSMRLGGRAGNTADCGGVDEATDSGKLDSGADPPCINCRARSMTCWLAASGIIPFCLPANSCCACATACCDDMPAGPVAEPPAGFTWIGPPPTEYRAPAGKLCAPSALSTAVTSSVLCGAEAPPAGGIGGTGIAPAGEASVAVCGIPRALLFEATWNGAEGEAAAMPGPANTSPAAICAGL